MREPDTKKEFEAALQICRELFAKKLQDYGASWRILRPASLTDQIFIKANRLRSLQQQGEQRVDESESDSLIAIVNYSIIGLIQLQLGAVTTDDLTKEQALKLYDEHAGKALKLMLDKNHDYGEAWRGMRVSSYVDLILMKIFRTKQIENHAGRTLVSEGIDANYMDMMNYAMFGLIKLEIEKE